MYRFLAMVCALLLLASCSGDGEEEKSKIRKKTDEIAHEAAGSIKRPLDKAQAVKDIEEQRIQRIKDQTEE